MPRPLPHLVKKSFRLEGHATSVALEAEFWQALQALAASQKTSMAALVAEIDRARTQPLASAIRVFVLRNTAKDG